PCGHCSIIAPIGSRGLSRIGCTRGLFGFRTFTFMRCHEITILSTVTHKRYCRAILSGRRRSGSRQAEFRGGTEMPTSRRDIILSAAVAGAWLGLDKSLAMVAPTEGQPAAPARPRRPPALARKAQTPDPRPGFLRYKVGDAEITALYDGIWEKVH